MLRPRRVLLVAAVVLALAMAGCAGVPHPNPGPRPGSVLDAHFVSTDAPWRFVSSGGCGLCSGAGGFGPRAEHHAFFVFEDMRILLVEFNEHPNIEGFHVHEDVDYDADALRVLLDEAVPRADAGETWVVRVATGRIVGDDMIDRLVEAWTTPGDVRPATDYAVHFGRHHENGTVESHDLSGPLHDHDPFAAFSRLMHGLERDARGVAQWRGAPPA